jgi:aminomethyltransferase
LYEQHLSAGASMVDFSGWEMPINYGSQLAEHRRVREHAGVFDVSHMTIVDVGGKESTAFLRYLLANDVARLDRPGRALYTGMLNDAGGVVDDLIVYRLQDRYRLVVNCATREKDLAWLARIGGPFAVSLQERRDLAILAVHGPAAIDAVCSILNPSDAASVAALGNFHSAELGAWFVARTGYTGEKGVEVMLPNEDAAAFWQKLLTADVQPVGLGARDTLRLEAGMNLYGHEMDDSTSPLSANMEFSISWEPAERDFVGRVAIERHKRQQASGTLPRLVGLIFNGRGVLRAGQKIMTKAGEGIITSGSFSPTLNTSIALARVPGLSQSGQVDMRGALIDVQFVRPCFVRFGKRVDA